MANVRTCVAVVATGLAVRRCLGPPQRLSLAKFRKRTRACSLVRRQMFPPPAYKALTYQATIVAMGAPHNNGCPNQTHLGVAAILLAFWSIPVVHLRRYVRSRRRPTGPHTTDHTSGEGGRRRSAQHLLHSWAHTTEELPARATWLHRKVGPSLVKWAIGSAASRKHHLSQQRTRWFTN